MSLKSLITAFLKLAISGLAIASIGGLVLVLSDDGDVAEAQADLTNLHPASVLQHGNFGRVMEESGLKAEPYDYNGNLVYFAHGESNLTPEELADYFQKQFVRAGINSRVYDSADFTDLDPSELVPQYDSMEELLGNHLLPEQMEQGRARLNGEVVPMHSSPRSMMMSGIIPHKKAQDGLELVAQLEAQSDSRGVDLERRINGFRFLEATYDERTGRSNLTATWSDHGFDPKKISEPKANHSMELELPPCIGCDRTTRIAALEREPFVVNQFTTSAGTHNVVDFYRDTMPRRGWQTTANTDMMDEIAYHIPELQNPTGEVVNFERDGHFINIFVTQNPSTHRTSVISVMGQ